MIAKGFSLLLFLSVLAGCSTTVAMKTPVRSNHVSYPTHMYNGVVVKQSSNWYLGANPGLRLNDKIQIVEVTKPVLASDFQPKETHAGLSQDPVVSDKEDSTQHDVQSMGVVTNTYRDIGGYCAHMDAYSNSARKLGSWKVHFDSNSAEPNDYDQLEDSLKELSPKAVLVIGFTDDVGSDLYNQKLSEQRALGMSDKLGAIWQNAKIIPRFGGECPRIVLNVDDESRALNRRVEILAFK